MKIPSISSLVAITVALSATGAAAQTTTDEARALVAQATARQQREAWAHAPVAEPVAAGDYRAAAHQHERVAQWQAAQRATRAYAAGVRSQPLAVYSEDSARAEAQRVHAQRVLAERAAALWTTAAVQ